MNFDSIHFPRELKLCILDKLNGEELSNFRLVNRQCKRLADDKSLYLRQPLADEKSLHSRLDLLIKKNHNLYLEKQKKCNLKNNEIQNIGEQIRNLKLKFSKKRVAYFFFNFEFKCGLLTLIAKVFFRLFPSIKKDVEEVKKDKKTFELKLENAKKELERLKQDEKRAKKAYLLTKNRKKR